MKELLLLKLRDVIASKEFEIAIANRENNMDGWLSDHKEAIICYDLEIIDLVNQIRICINNGE